MNQARHTLRGVVFSLTSFLAVPCLAPLAQGLPEASGQTDSAKFVGAEVCQSCHEGQYKTFAESAHVQSLKRKNAAKQGCEGCHGPGAAHVEAGDPDKIRRFPGARPETVQGVCAPCHKTNLTEEHTKARLTCLSCHSAHHYKRQKAMLVGNQSQLRQRCHRGSAPGRFHL